MKIPQFKLVNPKTLKPAAHNPRRRSEEDVVGPLMESMSKYGQLYPIIIDKENNVIDGHRRLTEAKMLNWESIQAIVTEDDPNAIYATVNSTVKKMSGSESLGVWLKNPLAVTERMRGILEGHEKTFGQPMMRQAYKQGMGLRIFRTAIQICVYCEMDDDESKRKALEWLMSFPVAGYVTKAIAAGSSPATLMKAIKNMKPIKMTATIAQ